jgi:hypothetical protein
MTTNQVIRVTVLLPSNLPARAYASIARAVEGLLVSALRVSGENGSPGSLAVTQEDHNRVVLRRASYGSPAEFVVAIVGAASAAIAAISAVAAVLLSVLRSQPARVHVLRSAEKDVEAARLRLLGELSTVPRTRADRRRHKRTLRQLIKEFDRAASRRAEVQGALIEALFADLGARGEVPRIPSRVELGNLLGSIALINSKVTIEIVDDD